MPVPATRLTQRRWRTSLAALAAIGMGSVLLEDLPVGATWVGAPARPVRRTADRPRESA